MSLSTVGLWASIASAVASLVGFPFIIAQLIIARRQQVNSIRLTTAQTLLSLDGVLASYSDIAAQLSTEWAHPNTTNPTDEEFPKVNPYVGLFERAFVAYQVGQVDRATLRALYDYRLWNIWNNHRIVDEQLQNDDVKEYWSYFIALTFVLEAERGCRYPLHTDDYLPKNLLSDKRGREAVALHRRIPRNAEDPFPWSWLNNANLL